MRRLTAAAGPLLAVVCYAGMPVGSASLVSPPVRTHHDVAASGVFTPYAVRTSDRVFATPPTTAQCRSRTGRACYSPQQFRRAYHLGAIYSHGTRGKGQTIVIVDSFGGPTVRSDLKHFDRGFHLPAPPSLRIIQPVGHVPAYDPNSPLRRGWALETALDVQYAHAIAPAARLLLVETPTAETLGRHGFPDIVKAENYVINHHLGKVISQSFGATEPTFPSHDPLRGLRSAFRNAMKHHVTVLAASGDAGATDAKTLGSDGFPNTFYARRVNSWPSSDPLVTSVGGTQLHLDKSGDRTRSDNVWNETSDFGSPAASGGGRSAFFSRPPFQNKVSSVVGSHRGTPDISMTAAIDGGAIIYLSNQDTGGQGAGFSTVGGTSLATPMFAGVVALANCYGGQAIGRLGPLLYAMRGAKDGIVDVTRGSNGVSFSQHGHHYRVKGFPARTGYDLSSGLGTINGAKFIPALAGYGALAHMAVPK